MVQISFQPSAATHAVGDIFHTEVIVDAGSQQVDSAEVHVDFDPTKLQVTDGGGNPVSTVSPGTALDTQLQNGAANNAGRIEFGAGKESAPFPTGGFTLATITFKALSPTGANGTGLAFVHCALRKSNAAFGGASVLDGAANGLITIT